MPLFPLLRLLLLLSAGTACAGPPPPGVVIHHSPAASGLYIGSPSICILADGSYLASHDYFGPESKEHERARGRLYRSADMGETWQHVTGFDGFFWQNLFIHRDAIYVLGTDKHHGNVVIRRSTDSGKSWTDPAILAEGERHTAPMPVIGHDGRLWRAIEDAHTSKKWGERYRARMMSAATGADLLDPASWTFSNALAGDSAWLDGDFAGWLEGNAVVSPQGGILNILRVDRTELPEKAAVVRIGADGRTATFDPENDFIEMPGGAKKFTIRKDPAGPGYWSLASIVPEGDESGRRPAGIRNTLALTYSDDLRDWEIRSILLYHPDVANHGFQYVDWLFEGDDIIAVSRTAWGEGEHGARNNHDANYLTFHRWQNFRKLTRSDDVPMPEFIPIVHETDKLTITGSGFQIAPLKDGETAFSNRNYTWRDVPPALAGMSFTRLGGGAKPILEVTAKADTTVRIATATNQKPIDLTGWRASGQSFHYDDRGKTRVHVYTRPLKHDESVSLPSGNWTGAILLFD